MSKPSSFELELIQKITRATSKLEALKRTHFDMCPVTDPHMAGQCTCGAEEHNSKVSAIISDLEIK
jgi:hypothetical protein